MLSETFTNPILAEKTITLSDGVERRFCWDLNAQILLAQVIQSVGWTAFQETVKNRLALLRINLWAGLHADAHQRLRDSGWDVLKVGRLMTGVDLSKLSKEVAEAMAYANHGPEAAPAKGSKKKQSRSRRKIGHE